jgi:hydroxyethylthiazole kinase-like uncharacterized protein yjeF
MKVVTVAQMRAIEAASDAAGHTYAEMMERAGRAVARALMARQDVRKKRILVLVGPGNNGGDGLVAARYLAQAGAEVACYLTRPRDPQSDENFRRLQELRVFCTTADADPDLRGLRQLAAGADVLIDALLGTGATPPLKGTIAQVLQTVGQVLCARAAPRPPEWVRIGGIPEPTPDARPLVVAVDGPSGLDFDTGALDPVALPADLTVTFACPKVGHFRFPGAAALGELVVADIGTDPALAADVDLEVVTPEMVRGWLPARPPDAHKGTFGRALIVAGSANYTGAARLAGAAAVRTGAGLVTVALPASIHSAVAATLSEATYLLLPHELGVLAEPAVEVLAEQAGRYDAMLLGPGLGQEKETAEFLTALLRGRERRPVGFLRTGETTVQPIPAPAAGGGRRRAEPAGPDGRVAVPPPPGHRPDAPPGGDGAADGMFGRRRAGRPGGGRPATGAGMGARGGPEGGLHRRRRAGWADGAGAVRQPRAGDGGNGGRAGGDHCGAAGPGAGPL